ncbi:type VII secretion protein EccB [Gordonia sp. ABSL1-1]|uniref:type VII secretion protein EccB n=1 Tax=Gordonia sp. ABSL1-1 TaxID=3053923 RepID=UPI0025744E38|nr:type VII secretion protein EccB [Gordonia sp. ABSL1-1]MDL9937751.1 type VII secretion protein EccB [Gordonia sp. ABSL1-1]
MPARLTTKAQVNGYRFLLRRLEHALVRRDSRMIHDPMRSQVRSMLVGFVVALLVVAACVVLAIFKPQPALGNSVIVVSDSSGAMFVRVNDVMHPVLNLTSARLITGKPENPHRVKDKDIRSKTVGPTLGIIGAPARINSADDLSRSDWTVCDTSIATGQSVSPFQDQTVVLSNVPRLTPDIRVAAPNAAAVAAAADGRFYLVYDGKRALIDPSNPILANALKLTGSSFVRMSPGLLSSLRPVAPITPLVIPNAGKPTRLPIPGDVPIGSIVKTIESSGTHQYVVLADRLSPVSDVAADIVRFSNPALFGDAVELSPASLNALPVGSGLPVDVSNYPAQIPEYTLGSGTTLCTHWFGPSLSSEPQTEMLVGDRLPIPDNAQPSVLVTSDGDGPSIDATYVPPGTGEWVQASGAGAVAGRLFYISDTGMRFAVPNPATADMLGTSGVRSADGSKMLPQLAPWSVIGLLPAGPTLSTEAALIAHGGFGGDPDGVVVPKPQNQGF